MKNELKFIGLTCVTLLAMYMIGTGILDIVKSLSHLFG